ncbi:hypothetical protein DERF_008784, partial [Dermatophagoides farinae]
MKCIPVCARCRLCLDQKWNDFFLLNNSMIFMNSGILISAIIIGLMENFPDSMDCNSCLKTPIGY